MPACEHMGSFSPNNRWLAYTSNESGRDEVYVRPFPRTEGVARLVSIGGGSGPVCAPNGSTLYYRGADGNMMAVPVTLDPTFTSGRPHPLFRFAGVYPDVLHRVTGGEVPVAPHKAIAVLVRPGR